MYVKPYINSSRNSLYFNELQIHINYKLISLLQSQFLRYLHSAVTWNSLTWNIRIKTICLWNSFERSSVTILSKSFRLSLMTAWWPDANGNVPLSTSAIHITLSLFVSNVDMPMDMHCPCIGHANGTNTHGTVHINFTTLQYGSLIRTEYILNVIFHLLFN